MRRWFATNWVDALRLLVEVRRSANADATVRDIETAIKSRCELMPAVESIAIGTLVKEFEQAVEAPRFTDRRDS